MLKTKDDGNNFSYINYQNKCKQTKLNRENMETAEWDFFFFKAANNCIAVYE